MYEAGQVSGYQAMQTSITTDIITLEILTHTPIIMYPKKLLLSVSPDVIQSGDASVLSAIVMNDTKDVLNGETVYFYESFTPVSTLVASPSVIQSGGTSTLTVKVKDSDGNLVSLNGATVKIYEITDQISCTNLNTYGDDIKCYD